ncbi:hypothetical protein BJX96DRAFT_56153 [Aspergillus floccosus]
MNLYDDLPDKFFCCRRDRLTTSKADRLDDGAIGVLQSLPSASPTARNELLPNSGDLILRNPPLHSKFFSSFQPQAPGGALPISCKLARRPCDMRGQAFAGVQVLGEALAEGDLVQSEMQQEDTMIEYDRMMMSFNPCHTRSGARHGRQSECD